MPLENFGSILNFAEELELQDLGFYKTVTDNPAWNRSKILFGHHFVKNVVLPV